MIYRALILCAMVAPAIAKMVQMEADVKRGSGWALHAEPTDASTKLQLTFALKTNNRDELYEKLLAVSTPSSPDYGKILSWDQIKEMTNPNAETVTTVTKYLSSFGVNNVEISSGFVRAVVDVNIAEQILAAKYKKFHHPITGEVIIRCDQYFLPEEIASVVSFVGPTVNFPRPMTVTVDTPAEVHQNTPDSLRELYNVNEVMGGKADARQAVTAFLHQYYLESDLQTFYKEQFPELLGTPISEVIGPNKNVSGTEAALDVEYMTVMGAGVATEFWSFAGRQPDNTENEPFLDWLYLLSDTENPPLVFSTSYGEDEASVSADYADRMNDEFAKNGLRGITFLFASGDSGVGSAFGACTTYTPQYPSDSPYVTAVGATTGVEPETAAGLSSGGFSTRYSRPSWQEDAVKKFFETSDKEGNLPDASLYNSEGRGFPDVSAQGTNFLVISNGQTFQAVAGTSCSSPTFGGIVGLLNDARLAAGKSPMGFMNPFIYANPQIFTDVTAGNNPGCGTDGFTATSGWDPVTGYGTPDYVKMLEAALALP